MNRRKFTKISMIVGVGGLLFPWAGSCAKMICSKKKVIVLGIDGMDPYLTRKYMQEGLLPNVDALRRSGSFVSVRSSEPPQSPVAWSNFSVGAPPLVHGIYDFIHRDPKTMQPYYSGSKVVPPAHALHLMDYEIPLSQGQTLQLRKGKPFWEYLAEREIPTTIFKMPANFPCKGNDVRMISGMGTPDLRGGYGSCTLFTTNPSDFPINPSGGIVVPVSLRHDRMTAHLPGPANTLRRGSPEVSIPLTVFRDKTNPVVRLDIQDKTLLLREGELSDWLRVEFPMLGAIYKVSGICKFYIKSVHPHFSMYVSPINIDPGDPVLPIAAPEKYARELVKEVGLFYTQGLPDDTKALSEGILTDAEYLKIAKQLLRERIDLLEYELKSFRRLRQGVLFFYVSSLDQNCHMAWRYFDKDSPIFDSDLYKRYGDTIKTLYTEMDKLLGKVLAQYDIHDPDNILIIMSDHGFTPFRRQVNLNNWLYEKGYLALETRRGMEDAQYFSNVRWDRTGAYNVGINSIYLNIEGREKFGLVLESQKKNLIGNLKRGLMDMIDPVTSEKMVTRVGIVSAEEKERNPHAPDIIVGWNTGYRNSWKSVLGGFDREEVTDNLDKWSGDHCVDPDRVPAILISNRNIIPSQPKLHDITATILNEFQIRPKKDFHGKPLYKDIRSQQNA